MLQKFWETYLEDTKKSGKCAGTICFGVDARGAQRAIERILNGEMRAIIYPAHGYRISLNGEAKTGDKNIVVDWNGHPCAIIETQEVRKLRLCDLTDEICADAGIEANVDAWRETQLPALKAEIEELDGEFDENCEVILETFSLVYENSQSE